MANEDKKGLSLEEAKEILIKEQQELADKKAACWKEINEVIQKHGFKGINVSDIQIGLV